MTNPEPRLKDIVMGFDIPQIIRFLYSGFLLVGLIQFTSSRIVVNDTFRSLGDVLSVILIFFVGVVIWTIYHQIIGEFFFFHVAHFFHKLIARDSSDMQLLADCGVPFGERRIAYEMLRNLYFSQDERRWVEMNHAHNQLLDITWIEIFFVLCYSQYIAQETMGGFWPFVAIGSACVVASVVVDIRQHTIERHLMCKKGRKELQDWLTAYGLVKVNGEH